MLSNFELPNRVHWTEGMILLPQHFHLSDNYVDAVTRVAMMNSRPFFWGVRSIEVDSTMLAEGVLRLVGFEGIFPDATPVTIGGLQDDTASSSVESVSISLNELSISPNNPTLVSVAICRENPKSASDFDGDLKRYSSVNKGSVADATNPESLAQVVVIQPVLRLVLNENMSPNHVGFPICRIEKSLDGTFKLLPFIPPILRFSYDRGSADTLVSRVIAVITDARTKAAHIRNLVMGRRSGRLNLDEQRRKVFRLSADLPTLESKLHADLPPFDVYSALLSYAAGLSEISENLVVPSFKPYLHNNLLYSFNEVLSFIEGVIAAIRLDFEALSFEETEAGYLLCNLSDRELQHSLVLSVTVPDHLTKEAVISWSESALICGDVDFEDLVQSRAIGYSRRRVVEYSDFGLLEGVNEVLVEVDLPHDNLGNLLIRGSDSSWDSVDPSSIVCFLASR